MRKKIFLFMFVFLLLTSCSTKCPQDMIEYTQKNAQYSLNFIVHHDNAKLKQDPLCIEVSQKDQKYLINIIHLWGRSKDGIFKEKTFVYFDYLKCGTLQNLESGLDDYGKELSESLRIKLSFAKKLEDNFNDKTYEYISDDFIAKYYLVPKDEIHFNYQTSPLQ